MAVTGLVSEVAFLRAVNLGSFQKVPMKELAALVAGLGATAVKTYIQSGNVVYRAPAGSLGPRIEEAIAARWGHRVPVVTRSTREMQAVLAGNPFPDTERLYVAFLGEAPGPEPVARLDPARSAPDEFRVIGREIYLRLLGGVAESKLTNPYFERHLKTPATARNWNTVSKICAMLQELDEG